MIATIEHLVAQRQLVRRGVKYPTLTVPGAVSPRRIERAPAIMGMEAEEAQLIAAVTADPRWQRLPDIQGMEAMWSYEIYRFAPESIERIGLKP